MTEPDRPDIIEQIDTLTDDAASWSATGGEHTREMWVAPAGSMTAIELGMVGASPVTISETEAAHAISQLVGDPFFNPIHHLRHVVFWVGDNSVARQPINAGATRLLRQMLTDVRDGNYVASDAERDHVRALLDSEDLPAIHGPCLITGMADDGDTPAPLNENFQHWFNGVIDAVAVVRQSLIEIAAELGIPLEQVRRISVISLG